MKLFLLAVICLFLLKAKVFSQVFPSEDDEPAGGLSFYSNGDFSLSHFLDDSAYSDEDYDEYYDDENEVANSVCPQGYEYDGEIHNCVDVNECEVQNGDCEYRCANLPGSYSCSCPFNMTLADDQLTCTGGNDEYYDDENEVANSVCPQGYEYDGEIHNCVDLDECYHDVHACDVRFEECLNTDGSYDCECKDGFAGERGNCEDVDECLLEIHDCDFNIETCINTDGGFTCQCNPGYTGEHGNCQKTESSNNDNKEPDNEDVIYVCPRGYLLNETSNQCTDINECVLSPTLCGEGGNCINLAGNFECVCNEGYVISQYLVCEEIQTSSNDNKEQDNDDVIYVCPRGYLLNETSNLCTDINECVLSPTLCGEGGNCINLAGNFECVCNEGYVISQYLVCEETESSSNDNKESDNGKGIEELYVCLSGYQFDETSNQCTDLDECLLDTNICGEGGNCVNLDGTFECVCKEGYVISQAGICEDFNECDYPTLHSCEGVGGTCYNTPGSYYCSCGIGFVRSSGICEDIDECQFSDTCKILFGNLCVNENGTYACNCRSNGFQLSSDGKSCEDIDECLDTRSCLSPSVCANTLGNYTCDCSTGYIQNGDDCIDVDECITGAHNCDVTLETCTNNVGGFACQCKQGYSGEKGNCTDVNECIKDPELCEFRCVNLQGGFKCVCLSGYELNAIGVCEDINECLTQNGGCDQNCENIEGGYFCSCDLGFLLHLNEHSCQDVNECQVQNGDCEYRCVNLPGGYSCSCPFNMTLADDQLTCRAITNCALKNGGCEHICSVEEDTLLCSCQPGFRLNSDGYHCHDIDECRHSSRGNCEQICVNTPGSWRCECNIGYIRRNDSLYTCQPVCKLPCLNNGVCTEPDTCSCPSGYPGPQCTAMCRPVCSHGGKCQRFNMCLCTNGWAGDHCTEARCNPPCANGGRCVAPNQCKCSHLYTGRFCQSPLCSPPCENGGNCFDVNKCTCPEGWQGSRCQTRSSPFKCTHACRNGGTCVGPNKCKCLSDYTGRHCQTEIVRKCRPTCRNGGTCLAQNKCACQEGTKGIRCQTITCPRVTTRVPVQKFMRRGIRESYKVPCGRRICTKWRVNQHRVPFTSYKIVYNFQC